MPFDEHSVPLPATTETKAAPAAARDARSRPVAIWLFTVAAMILVMVVLGGATRLTGSGLSIMEWAPLSGALPPLNQADWERLFTLYKGIPQYELLHHGMGLGGFKQIFWLEWIHRLWGRLLGIAFAAPLIWFWATGRIDRRLRPRLVLLFVLGGLQGAVGWFMVASGFFPDTTSVSPYRLVIHLALALALYAALIWTGLSLLPARVPEAGTSRARVRARIAARITLGLVAVTIVAGGFVAGNHAGLDYNTFPLMDGRLIPAGFAPLHPWIANLFQTIPAVQFNHRLLATLTAIAALATTILAFTAGHSLRWPAMALAGAVAAQYALGVATLLSVVLVPLAVLHQAAAVLLLTASLVIVHALRDRAALS